MQTLLSRQTSFMNLCRKTDPRYLWIFIATLVCYWPLSMGIFTLKNDNIHVFLAFRYNISEAVQSGNLPLWSPYIDLGYPLHADMQSSAWNPIVLFLSMLGRYNIHSFHAETLLYIFLSGIGMYKLLQQFISDKNIACTLAFCYLACGFITDTGGNNILFLSAAAFIPFVILYTYKSLKDFKNTDAAKAALSMVFLLTASYPFFFIAVVYILVAGFTFRIIQGFFLKRKKEYYFSLFRISLLAGVLFLMLASPAIFSFYDLLNFYERGSSISLSKAQQNNFEPKNILSLIFPQASSTVPGLSTDLIMRNMYFGLYNVVFLVLFFTSKFKKPIYGFIVSGILFFFLFGLGKESFVRAWSYHNLPFMNVFRHVANARLFVIIGSLHLSAVAIEHYKNSMLFKNRLTYILFTMGVIVIGITVIDFNPVLVKEIYSDLLYLKNNFSRSSLKTLIDNFSYGKFIIITGIIQLIFILWFLHFNKNRNNKTKFNWLLLVFCINSFLFCQLSIPLTMVSKISPANISSLIKKYPKGFPKSDLNTTIASNNVPGGQESPLMGTEHFYNKKISVAENFYNPTVLYKTSLLFRNKMILDQIMLKPVAYLGFPQEINKQTVISGDTSSSKREGALSLVAFNNNSFLFTIHAKKKYALCLQQTYLPGWKAQIDGRNVPILEASIAFMYIQIPVGPHTVKLFYRPWYIDYTLALAAVSLIILFLILLNSRGFKQRT